MCCEQPLKVLPEYLYTHSCENTKNTIRRVETEKLKNIETDIHPQPEELELNPFPSQVGHKAGAYLQFADESL